MLHCKQHIGQAQGPFLPSCSKNAAQVMHDQSFGRCLTHSEVNLLGDVSAAVRKSMAEVGEAQFHTV